MTPFLGELFGTMILIILGCGVVANVSLNKSKAQNGGWIVITLAWGLGVTMGVYAVGQISGAHLNPAVTIGFAAIGDFPWADVPAYVAGQMIGGVIGGVIVYLHFFAHWKATDDPAVKLGVFATSPAIRHPAANLLSEIIGTAVLLIGLLSIGSNEFTEGLNPFIVGFLIVAIGLSLGGPTGYAINPARDLGPRIAHFILPIPGKGGSDWGYAWIPVVGPIIGGIYGAVLYRAVFDGAYGGSFWLWTAITVGSVLLTRVADRGRGSGADTVTQ
ncbi:MIP/aquaporin family protein [Numidum massiliense]|uniref:MIP/aquaporin family protein n=1 Tax=Numidum massiliense TaxID=1522315 RepID=UPI0006D5A744|nr:MIP/aquaporin family protein [Numidum massiliense]